MVQVSIIICTHNPRRHHLDRVIGALRTQDLPYTEWELLLVDNASETTVERHFDLSWHPNSSHIREDELGLAAARRRGIAEATADLLIFVDDDNVLEKNYLSEALRIKQKWPALGTWGSGTIVPEFEQQPADHLKPYLACLALRDNRNAYWSNVLSCSDAIPAGAGLCVRASVAREYIRLNNIEDENEMVRITGRKGKTLVGHEDYEIAFIGCCLGFGMGVFPELRMTHLIPKERVMDEYFLRLAEGNELSGGLLAYKWMGSKPPDPFSAKGILSMVKNVVLTGGFHRRYHLALVRGRIAATRALAKNEDAYERQQILLRIRKSKEA
jgi:glycosyltransferase involved in cell wall biosynthesis